MSTDMVFKLEMTMGLIWMGLVAGWYILPRLHKISIYDALTPPLLIAVLRFHGMNFLVPEINNGLSSDFAIPAAYGDFAVCLIALAAAVACRKRMKIGITFAWIYAILGALDFANGFYLGEIHQMPLHLGPTWFMVIYEAPLQITALFVLFRLLTKHPELKVI